MGPEKHQHPSSLSAPKVNPQNSALTPLSGSPEIWGEGRAPQEMQWSSSRWPQMASACRGGACLQSRWHPSCVGLSPASSAGPPQRPIWVSQSVAVANEGLDSSKPSFQEQVNPTRGQDTSRAHKTSNCLKDTGCPAGGGVRMGTGVLSESAGVLGQTAAGCWGGRGMRLLEWGGGRAEAWARAEGRGWCQASFHTFQPHSPGCY